MASRSAQRRFRTRRGLEVMGDAGIHAHRGYVPDAAAARGVEGEVVQAHRAARLGSEPRTQAEGSVEVAGSRVVRRVIAAVRSRPDVRCASDEIGEPGQTM